MISVGEICQLVLVLAVAVLILVVAAKVVPAISRYIDRAKPADEIGGTCSSKYLSFRFGGTQNRNNEKDHQTGATVDGQRL